MTRVEVNEDGLKFSGTHQLLVFAYELMYWAEAYIPLKRTAALVIASKEI